MKIRIVFFTVLAFFAFKSHCVSQSNFGLELLLGIADPNASNDKLISAFDTEFKTNSINFTSNLRLHYKYKEKDLFFVQFLYSKTGNMDNNISNMIFPLDVDKGTISSVKSSFNMSYVGFGVGTAYTTKFNFFIDVSMNYIRHIDNTFSDVFFSGWDQLSTLSEGEFRSSNLLGSLGVGYRFKKTCIRIGYEKYIFNYQLDSTFGESNSRSDISISVGYRI